LARDTRFAEGADLGERCPQLVSQISRETPLVLEGLRQALYELIKAIAKRPDLHRHAAERQGPYGLIDGDLLRGARHPLERLQPLAHGEYRGERADAEDRYNTSEENEIDLAQQPKPRRVSMSSWIPALASLLRSVLTMTATTPSDASLRPS